MKQKTTGDIIGELLAVKAELDDRKARVRVKIDRDSVRRSRIETIKQIREITGLGLADAMKAVDNAIGGDIDITLTIVVALRLPEIVKLGHSYKILP